jgi:hypothetical protein
VPYSYSETFERLARTLGFADDPVRAVVHFRAPSRLANWTLPAVEGVMIGGAGLALGHAVQRWRRHDDPASLTVWVGSVAYLLVTEPPLYFPRTFHLPESVSDVFAHNVFSVQLMYEHLPLYIVALYPAVASLAYETARSLGAFDGGELAGAACVGFVHHAFYEVFDHIGPQLRWWAWNPDAESNQLSVGSVPLASAALFATVGPAALTLATRLLVGRKAGRGERAGGWELAGRSLAAGAAVPVMVALSGAVTSVIGRGRPGAQAAALSSLIGLCGAAGVPAMVRGWRRRRAAGPSATGDSPWFAAGYGGLYLAAFGLLWGKALPAYTAATDGVTADGTPTGSLAYTLACAGLAAAAVAGAATANRGPRPPGAGGWRARRGGRRAAAGAGFRAG